MKWCRLHAASAPCAARGHAAASRTRALHAASAVVADAAVRRRQRERPGRAMDATSITAQRERCGTKNVANISGYGRSHAARLRRTRGHSCADTPRCQHRSTHTSRTRITAGAIVRALPQRGLLLSFVDLTPRTVRARRVMDMVNVERPRTRHWVAITRRKSRDSYMGMPTSCDDGIT